MERLEPESFIGERISGRFVVDRLIGSGPLSAAFRATDQLLQRRVTVKIFSPDHPDDVAVMDSQLELATAVARLTHPNIVTVIDRGEHEGMPFVVLEYVRGENLQERLERFAPLSVAEVVGYGIDIARALAYAHAQGVVHGNLRPGNILISEEREVKLVDFGGGSYIASLTGSDPYLPPERRAHDGPVLELSPAEDIFALGTLLFVALTEHSPAAGIEGAALQMLRPDASPRLAAAVSRAMAEVVEDRHASMHELAADLSAARPSTSNEQVRPDAGLAPWEVDDTVVDEMSRQATTTVAAIAVHEHERPHGLTERQRDRGRRRVLRHRTFGAAIIALPLAGLVLVGVMLAGEHGRSSQPAADVRGGIDGPTYPVPVTRAGSFDPQGTPPRQEHEELAGNVHDGDAATTWNTETYQQQSFRSAGKEGVGIWVRLGSPVAATRLDMELPRDDQGWPFTVYAANGAPARLEDWTKVSNPSHAEQGRHVRLDTGEERYDTYMVWMTALSLDPSSDLDKQPFRNRIGEITVRAPESS